MGLAIHERPVPRETLYTADELFFTGTATEVTPIRSVDRIRIGAGKAGPITKELQSRFMAIARGEREAPGEWLTHV
jgi:branched-chain amino acid aminotransferase